MGVGNGAIGCVVSVSITCRLRSYCPPQRWIFSVDYCLTCLSGSATVVSLDICFGRKEPSATSFMSLITLVWWTGISSSAVSPGIGPYPLYRDVGGIQFIRHFKVTLGQIQSTWSFHSRHWCKQFIIPYRTEAVHQRYFERWCCWIDQR